MSNSINVTHLFGFFYMVKKLNTHRILRGTKI